MTTEENPLDSDKPVEARHKPPVEGGYTTMTIYRDTGDRFRRELNRRGLKNTAAVNHIINYFLSLDEDVKDKIYRGDYT